MKRRRGFTLIELLVAISILAIVAVLGWRGLDAIVRARVSLNDDLEQTRGLQLAFAQMQSDCQNIADAATVGNRPVIASQPGVLTMLRMVYAENQPSRVQVVTYRIRDGTLTRSESGATRDLSAIDASWSAVVGDTDTSPKIALKTGVDALTVRSWAVNGTAWRNGIDTTSATASATASAGNQPITQTGQPTVPGTPSTANSAALNGIEVSLTLHDRPGALVKIFLLGAA